ncbi:MAG: D-alanyl-D-alanine carboxypeptidase, partial [Bacteroidota bacterium]
DELSEERIKTRCAAGGVSGTIENWYGNPEGEPYVFAKTGTLSNKHALSGFLFTRSGKKLIFSFMHNNYITSSSVLKVEMEQILRQLYEEY